MSSIRHMARQRAMQLLYAVEFAQPANVEDYLEVERRFLSCDPSHRRGWGPFARDLSRNVFAKREELDNAIAPLLHKWKIERLPILDRVCLRMALCELREFADIPLRVTINEYIELVRQFSSDESTQYINAVLDKLAREFPNKDFKSPPKPKKPQPPTETQSTPSEEPQP
ncbi:transcription antitermination factor NusB [bacterium]|nr:transcription antitermination factor NusB [bacterium]